MNDDTAPLGPFERRLLAQLHALQEEQAKEAQPFNTPARSRTPSQLARSAVLGLAAATTLVSGAFAAKAVWKPVLGGTDRGSPSAASTVLPAVQRRQFAVLARPQRDVDRGAETERVLGLLSPGAVDEIHTADVRVLFRSVDRGVTAILLPVGSYGADWPRLFQRASGRDGLCLLLAVTDGPVSQQCYASGEATEVRLPATTAGLAYGLVPDGVAAVRIMYTRKRPTSAKVRDNFYLLRTPHGAGSIAGVRWLAPDGRTVAARSR